MATAHTTADRHDTCGDAGLRGGRRPVTCSQPDSRSVLVSDEAAIAATALTASHLRSLFNRAICALRDILTRLWMAMRMPGGAMDNPERTEHTHEYDCIVCGA